MRKDIRELLRKLEKKNRKEKEANLPTEERMRSIPPETGLFLHLLVKISRAKNILEIGSSQGYSTIWLASACEEIGAKMTSLEINERSAAKAQRNLRQVKLDGLVRIKIGDAKEILPNLKGRFDFIFIDAEKKDYLTYFNLIQPILENNGLMVADNIISHAEILSDYKKVVEKNPDFQNIIIPIGSGEMLSYKAK